MSQQSSSEQPRRTIIISPGVWRGFDVAIEPPSSSWQLRHFRSHTDAAEWAQGIAEANGWPVVDRTSQDLG